MQHLDATSNPTCHNCHSLQTEIVALKEELSEMKRRAYYDELTGLGNRRYFIDSLESRISRCQRYGDNCAVLFLDVDNLKAINDEHGHAAGDALLVRLGEILRINTRTSDVTARIGGDEFCLLLDNLDSDRVVDKIASLAGQFAAENYSFNGKKLPVSAAIGYCFVGPKDTVEGLMSRADAAMYRVKDKPE